MYEPEVNSPESSQKDYGMKWFKFLIYFALFAAAVINLGNAMRYLNGTVYLAQGISQYELGGLYRQFPKLKTLDYAYAIVLAGLAVFAIVVRFRLAGYRSNAPGMFFAMIILNAACSIGYSLLSCKITAVDPINAGSGILATAMFYGIYLCLNRIYFDKRRDLFQN